jgi:hypothetical protein
MTRAKYLLSVYLLCIYSLSVLFSLFQGIEGFHLTKLFTQVNNLDSLSNTDGYYTLFEHLYGIR